MLFIADPGRSVQRHAAHVLLECIDECDMMVVGSQDTADSSGQWSAPSTYGGDPVVFVGRMS